MKLSTLKYLNILVALILVSQMSFVAHAQAKLEIVTSTSDLAALVKAVAADKVNVWSVVKGTQDAHQIDAKPSFMVKMRDADLVIEQGLELEDAWMIPLITGSRNPKITSEGKGILALGDKLDPLEVPSGSVSRAEGDVHPGGNPHFTPDPIRMGKAGVMIAERLGEMDPTNAAFYKSNAETLQKHLEAKTKEWQARINRSGVKEIVTYHKTFSYFCERFGLICKLQLEPKPGIPPTASHILEVIQEIKERHIKLVLIENLYDDHSEDKLQTAVPGLHVVRVPIAVGGEPGIDSTEQLMEKLVKTIEENGK